MNWIDLSIVIVPLIVVVGIAVYTQRYMKGVADFLTAGRVAGRYVICVSGGEAGMGLITVVAMFQLYYNSGFALGFWESVQVPILLVLALTGFAVYRYRETRVMTMAQFFEIRYSKRFRTFAGVLQAFSGILNYGIFPAVGARFLIYFTGMPQYFDCFGLRWQTFGVMTAAILGFATAVSCSGGQLTVMVVDCVLGILSYPLYLILVVAVFMRFSWWHQMAPPLLDRPAGSSMLNPFDISDLRDFNLLFIVVGIISNVYNLMSWSGNQGFNAAASNAHEQKMGKILGTWRAGFSQLMVIVLAIAGFTALNRPEFSAVKQRVESHLSVKVLNDILPSAEYSRNENADEIKKREASLSPKQTQVYHALQTQMRVPMTLREVLPVGITGIFCALMVFMMVASDTSYLHSWGGILVQDIILPNCKRQIPPRLHLWMLRLAILAVATFAFFFSLFFGQVTYIFMFFALSGAIYLGGAGAVIIGGLYWKKATAAGAWAAMIAGTSIAMIGFVATHYWVDGIYSMLARWPSALQALTHAVEGFSHLFEPIIQWRVTPDNFFLNGREVYLFTMLSSIGIYIVVSLVTYKEDFNIDRMLHRGVYRKLVDTNTPDIDPVPIRKGLRGTLECLIGVNEEFSKGDKAISWSVFIYSIVWALGSWMVALLWNLIGGFWPASWWANWFFITNIVVASIVGVVSTVWFSIGGSTDLRRLFINLKTLHRNSLDDGRVVGHMNADDAAALKVEAIEPPAGAADKDLRTMTDLV